MYPSSFHGKIDEIPGISVDNFERSAELRSRAYFLSHCHTDHTQGLYTWELWNTLSETKACIYMSEASAAIVQDSPWSAKLMKYIKPLPLGKTTVTLPGVPSQNLEETSPLVTLIPAGHCFGSVMFLFKTESKTILYTGDFRMHSSDLAKYAALHEKNDDPIKIDALYVDTTFLNAKYLSFPKRSDSVQALIDKIESWLGKDDNNRIALHVSARYGYENIYNEVYDKLGLKIYVNEDRWRFYSKLQHLVKGVTNSLTSKIHLCTNWGERNDHRKCLENFVESWNFLYVHCSAQKWEGYVTDELCVEDISDKRLNVCFATHCSRSELVYFKNYLAPKRVVGFPNPYIEEESPIKQDKTPLVGHKRKNTPSPWKKREMKMDKKVDTAVLRNIFG